LKAVRFVDPNGETRIGALEENVITDAGAAWPGGFLPTEQGWLAIESADGPEYERSEVRLLHPVHPGKIIAIGLNYRAHAEESGVKIPSVPVVFAIWPSALIGDRAEIIIPKEETRPDYEGELAIVIGRPTYRADREEARAAVGGISAFNDVSGRRAQFETPLQQFTLGKSFDTFSPMGPCIARSDGIDLGDVDVRTTVSVEELIMYLSAGVSLLPGDVIATGTPGGVGDSREPPRYLQQGDTVEIYVGGVGTLTNPVRLER
jgi:2-keto-4-pentenoate hydratase/2-oxohepta-3-ene-1,7-dioic acid hydratase in catechol pathway